MLYCTYYASAPYLCSFPFILDRCTQVICREFGMPSNCQDQPLKRSATVRDCQGSSTCVWNLRAPRKNPLDVMNLGRNHDKPLDWMLGPQFFAMHLFFCDAFVSTCFFLVPNLAHVFFWLFFFLHRPGQLVTDVIRCSSHHVKRLVRCPGDLIRRRVLIGSNRSSWVARRNSRRPSLIVFWWPELKKYCIELSQ